MAYPDFLIIGAQKAGTTWLHRNLQAHPGVWTPEVKELHYFDEKIHAKGGLRRRLRGDGPEDIRWRRQARAQRSKYASRLRDKKKLSLSGLRWNLRYFLGKPDDAWYASLFLPGVGKIRGEATPEYSVLDEAAIARAHELMPDARIILMTRSPVERAWSATSMLFRLLGRRMETMTDEELGAHFANKRVKLFADYLETLRRWGRFYPPEQIFVGFLEDVHFQPAAVMRRVYNFLGADTSARYRVIRQKVHTGSDESMPARSAVYLARAYRGELERLAEAFGGYASFWLYCAEKLADGGFHEDPVPYPLWESSLWREWVDGPGAFVKTPPGENWIQSGPLDGITRAAGAG